MVAAWLCAAAPRGEEPAAAERDGGDKRASPDSVALLVVSLTSCAALHFSAQEALNADGSTAHAEEAKRRGQAAAMTAMYVLAQSRISHGGAPQPLSSFRPYVDQMISASLERMAAIIKNGDVAQFRSEEETCASLSPLEDEVIAKIAAE